MLDRYGGNIDYILRMKWEDGLMLIKKAYDKDTDEKIYNRWLHEILSNPEIESMSFAKYKEKLYQGTTENNNKIDDTKEKEIQKTAEKIIEADGKARAASKIKLPGRL